MTFMPIEPPAPGRFSTTMLVCSSGSTACAVSRASVSAPPPGGVGTISRIGEVGYSAARASRHVSAATPRTATRTATKAAASRFAMIIFVLRRCASLRDVEILAPAILEDADHVELVDVVEDLALDRGREG